MSDRYKFLVGYTVVLGLLLLGVAVALGKVEEKTSYGLVPILGIVGKIALDFSEWAFRGRRGVSVQVPVGRGSVTPVNSTKPVEMGTNGTDTGQA